MLLQRPLLVLIALGTTYTTAVAAQQATTYTTVAGDTCDGIAARHYGDRKRYDLIHAANPSLGPLPHMLKPGTVLVLPPLPATAEAPSGPDARLTSVRNRVDVHTPATRPGQVNDPLNRGNRVSTEDSSAATVNFRDDTRMFLGQNTLVVILGDSSKQASSTLKEPASASLVNGSLRTSLAALSGKKPPTIDTDSGSVGLGAGETQVSVDQSRTTRLAVYKGTSTLNAQKKTVKVDEGFGSKAPQGKPPTEPRPLPDKPTWTYSTRLVINKEQGRVQASYAQGPGAGPTPAQWHVQIARDSGFENIVTETRVPAEIRTIDLQNADPGEYFMRVSGIDSDAFEGPWSPATTTTAVVLKVRPGSTPYHRQITVDAKDVTCGLDGEALPANGEDILVRKPRTVTCSLANGEKQSLEIPAFVRGPLVTRIIDVTRESPTVFKVRYQIVANGSPVEVTAYRSTGTVSLSSKLLSDDPENDFRVARVSTSDSLLATGLKFTVDDQDQLESPPISLPKLAKDPEKKQSWQFDVTALGGGAVTASGDDPSRWLGAQIGARFGLGSIGALHINGRALFTQSNESVLGTRNANNIAQLSVPVMVSFPGSFTIARPYLGVELGSQIATSSLVTSPADQPIRNTAAFAGAMAGGMIRSGHLHAFGEFGVQAPLADRAPAPTARLHTLFGVGATF